MLNEKKIFFVTVAAFITASIFLPVVSKRGGSLHWLFIADLDRFSHLAMPVLLAEWALIGVIAGLLLYLVKRGG